MQIIRAYPRHLPLAAPLFDQYRQFYQQQPDAEGARQFLWDRLERADSVIFLAVEGSGNHEKGLGFLQLYPSFSSTAMKPAWILNDLFVAVAARKKGVAKALMERARRLAVETNAVEVMLQTGVGNQAAQALYEQLGYRRDTEFATYLLAIGRS